MRKIKVPTSKGHIILSVEDDATDEDIKKAIAEYEKDLAYKKSSKPFSNFEPEGSFSEDFKRVALDTQRDLIRTADFFIPGDTFGLDELSDREREQKLSEMSGFGYIDTKGAIDSATGKIKDAETLGGQAFSLVPYLATAPLLVAGGSASAPLLGTRFAATGLSKMLSKPVVKYTLAGAGAEQILSDPDENLINIVREAFPEQTQGTILDYLEADEDDTEASKRLKMAISDLGAGVAIEGLLRVVPATVKAIKAKNPNATDSEVAENVLKESKDSAIRNQAEKAKADLDIEDQTTELPSMKEQLTETEEGIKQIELQNTANKKGLDWFISSLAKVKARFFTVRGFATQLVDNVFKESQQRQAALISEGVQVGNRLERAIYNTVDSSLINQEKEKVQIILESDLSFLDSVPLENRVSLLSSKGKISEETAEAIIDSRNLINRLSKLIVRSDGFSSEVKDAIKDNFGSYIRRSYDFFETPGFEVDDVLKQNAIRDNAQYILESERALGKEIDLETALKKSRREINELLDKSDNETMDFFTQVKRVAKFHRKKDIPETIRKLLGEIRDPKDNVIISATKAARIYEVNNFYRQLATIGAGKYNATKGAYEGYIVGKDTAIAERLGINSDKYKIKDTNFKYLEGKVTTPEMLEFINRQEEILGFAMNNTTDGVSAYKTFLRWKGFSQSSKTVLSHVTHLRNLLGGMQFGLANGDFSGVNPVSYYKNSGVIWNKIRNLGDKEKDQYYNKLIRLGVINTNINVNQARELMDLQSSNISVTGVVSPIQNSGVFKTFEDVYMGTDDFFKLSNFENELSWLKKAFPDQQIDVLEEQAANIVKDTFPNYNRVPKGIKKINYSPIGNFISFPSEIIRTSINIVRQASEEITSGNTVLRNRGLARLGGFTATTVGFGAAADASAKMMGWNEEETRAYNELAAGKYNKNANNIWFRNDEGETIFVSTKYLDSYNTIKLPVVAVLDKIVKGELKGKQLESYLLEAAGSGAAALLEPFITESIATKAILDIYTAASSEDGRTADGRLLLPPSMDTADKAGVMLYKIYESIEPGSLTSMRKVVNTTNKFTGEEAATVAGLNKYELFSNSGLRFNKFDPELQLSFAVRTYKKLARNNIRSVYQIGKDTSVDVLDNYIARQAKHYKYQQDLYQIADAYRKIYNNTKAYKLLRDGDLSDPESRSILSGKFKPIKPPEIEGKILEVIEKYSTEDINSSEVIKSQRKYKQAFKEFEKLTLYQQEQFDPFVLDEETKEELTPVEYAKGGVVDIPNAPVEPDERINKLTGLPYTETAGPAFQDNEDETDPLRRLGFEAGGRFDYEYFIANKLGFNPEDLKAVEAADKRYPISQRFSSSRNKVAKGDMLRHFMLGVAAARSKNPKLSQIAIQAREDIFRIIGDGDRRDIRQDKKNNDIGYNFYKNPKEITMDQALQDGMKLIEEGKLAIFE